MILDKKPQRSARWNTEENAWAIKDYSRYCWLYPDGITEASPWFDDIDGALEWIKIYDRELRKSA